MNVRHAALKVLQKSNGPISVREICDRMVAEGLWQPQGKTPQATVAARLYTDIKKRGDASPFVLVAPQTFALRDSLKAPVAVTSTSQLAAGKYSFTDAAEKILEQFGDKKPMHYRDITAKAIELNWIATEGKTPEATMYAQILTEIRRHQKKGKQPRFVQHGQGVVSLSRWMGKGLAFEIEQHNKRMRQALLKKLLEIDWGDFEELVARLLAEIGFEDIEVTKRSGDGGIDVRGTLVVGDVIRTRMAVQVKRWKPKLRVQSPVVQQVRGSLGTHEQGLIITTSDFSQGARTEAARANAVPVALMNGEEFVTLLAAYGIGVSRQAHEIIDLEQ